LATKVLPTLNRPKSGRITFRILFITSQHATVYLQLTLLSLRISITNSAL
jgi:hypothetical protein